MRIYVWLQLNGYIMVYNMLSDFLYSTTLSLKNICLLLNLGDKYFQILIEQKEIFLYLQVFSCLFLSWPFSCKLEEIEQNYCLWQRGSGHKSLTWSYWTKWKQKVFCIIPVFSPYCRPQELCGCFGACHQIIRISNNNSFSNNFFDNVFCVFQNHGVGLQRVRDATAFVMGFWDSCLD